MNWDDCRLFFACAEFGSLRKAGAELGLDAATVARRIDRLEKQLGQRLAVRFKDGVKLTPFGHSVFEEAASMMKATQNIERLSSACDTKGVVRLAVTEGLGTYWILPKLVDWQRGTRAGSWFSDSKGDSRIGESLIPYVMRMTEEQDGSGLQPGFA